jgi:amino acid adenylation domain-containing protein
MTTSAKKNTRRAFARYCFSREIYDEIRQLNRSDNWHSLLFLSIDFFWIALAVAACHLVSWWLYPVTVLIIGARQRALSTIFHDCVHGTAAANKKLELVLGTVLTAYPIFQLYSAYKISHVLNHHPKLGDPDRDPDLQYFLRQNIYQRLSRWQCFVRIVILPMLGARTFSFLRYLFTTRFRIETQGGKRSILESKASFVRMRGLDRTAFCLFWATVVLLGWWTDTLVQIAIFWIVPYLTTFQLVSWFIELSEHTPLMRDLRVDLYMARNRKSRGLEKFLTGIHNDDYHWDHHLDPRTPCWNLPKAHAVRMKDENFAALDRAMGALFTQGPEGQPSVLSEIITALSTHSPVRFNPESVIQMSDRHQSTHPSVTENAEQWFDAPVHILFERQVATLPDAVALVCDDSALTYRELDEHANQLARHLRRLGVRAEITVALVLERDPGMIVAMLAVLKAGGAYVPLDCRHPDRRIAYMVEDCGAAVVLTQERLVSRLAGMATPIVCLDSDRWRWSDSSTDRLHIGATRRDLAYVIYTSGSTGLPKGVMIEHRSFASLLSSVQSQCGYGEDDRVFQFGSFSFDVAQQEIFSALLAGACLVLRSERQALDPSELLRVMDAQRITKTFFPTAYWHSFTAELATIGARLPASLRLVLVAGEAMRPEMVALWQEHWGDSPELVNAYGPTETTIFATTFTVPSGWCRETPISIGRPLPHVTAYVLDAKGEPAPQGVTGELYIGGRQVARGYLNRPKLTAERFVPDALGRGNGARLYKTGDLARTTPDGGLEYLGRCDSQVKIRGFRIELEEVESHVASAPGVRQAVVLTRKNHLGDWILVAYVASSRGERLVPDQLREHLATRLPEYMVPSAFVVLDALPLTINGKIDRGCLPPPDLEASDKVLVEPATPTERSLVEIVSEVLGRTRIGVTDSFLALGGHSLLAAKVAARIRARLHVELFVRDVLLIPVLRELAAHIESLDPSTAEQPVPSIPKCPRAGRLQASYAQERLWFLDQLVAGTPAGRAQAYLLPAAFSMSGGLDVGCLERAIQTLVDRHESLRTSLISVEGLPMQVVASSVRVDLPVTDLSTLSGPAQDEALQDRLRSHRETSFDLAAGGLLRVELVCLCDSSHVLLVTMHHIISDGWSMGVFMRELTTLYSAYLERHTDPLPALTIQYADFAAWQRADERAPKLAEQLGYWERQLADLPVLALPADRPRPPLETFAGSVHYVSLSRELTARLQQLGHAHDATLFMVTGTAFAILLGRYANEKEVVFGAPVANRTTSELDGLIGMFVNSVVLRASAEGACTYAALLRRFRSVCLAAYANQEVPFEQVVRAINPGRSLARNPLFQVMFQLASDPYDGLRMAGVAVQPLRQETRFAMFDLSVDLEEREGHLLAKFEYNTDLFDAATIQQMASHFETLLEDIVTRPHVPAAELSMLSEGERERLLIEFAGTADETPADVALHELFEEQAARSPGTVAVVFDDQLLTYSDLNERANRLARHLQRLGVGPDSLVSLALERGTDAIVAMLAVLKAGGAYVPIDPEYPAARIRYLLEDSNAGVIVTQQALLSRLPECQAQTVCVDRDAAQWSGASPANLELVPAAGQLAYVIYTSGSTGLPKGAMIEYGSLSRYIAAVRSRYRLNANDRVFQFASFGFDVAGEEIFSALISGACLILRSDRHSLPPADLLRVWEQLGVTKVDLPTAYWHHLTAEAAALECRLPASLRLVVIGGEAARPDMVALWQRHWGVGLELVNAYGPTETTVTAIAYTLPATWRLRATVPLGTPFAGARVYVLDQACGPVPVGVPGEIHIGGTHVGRGYLNRPELTAERFVPNPFAGGAHARLYRTGDMGRWLPDGNLEYLGRSDSQVKVRGFRIELREIESHLADHPSVSEAVVVAREDQPGDRRLIAYLVPAGREAPDPQKLRDHLRSQLPAYMIPNAFVVLEALPLNANGKIDREALPAPEYQALDSPFEPPSSTTERAVADLFAEILHVPRVSVSDNFFLLGGHSLLATQLVARVRDRLHRDLLVRDLLSYPVVADLASHLDSLEAFPQSLSFVPIPKLARGQPLPASFAQERLWFIDQLETLSTGRSSRVYLMPEAFALLGSLDVDALRRALQTIVDRHETLRTSLIALNGTPMQVVTESRRFTLDVADLSTLPDAERREALAHELRTSADTGFELSAEFLFRAALVRLSADSHVLMVNLHHSVSDGWSMDVLMRELGALYSAYVERHNNPLSTLPCQYADYAAWQRSSEQTALMSRQLSYWRDELADLPTLALPTDRSRPQVETFSGAAHRISLSTEMTERLRQLGQREDATLFMTLGAAFAVLLGHYSNQTDVVYGVPTANRGRPDIEGLIGLFVNTVVLRVRLEGGLSFRAFLQEFRQICLRAYAHQDVPFEHVVSALNPARSAAHNPLFQVMFQLLVTPREEPELRGLKVTPIAQETRSAQFDLCLDLLDANGQVTGIFEYNTDLFDRSTIERMSRHFENLLHAVLTDPTTPILDLDLAEESERHQVVFDFNAPYSAESVAACVHELFERQAARSPERPAMVFENQRFTYGELNAEANRLAHHLRSLGAAPGTLVGLLLERDASVIVSMLAVLKTGAAYVAMDPKSPAERIAYMLEDSGANLVLTHERVLAQLPRTEATMICVDRDGASWAQREAGDLGCRVALDSLAYAIYTSGSTGLPKGVLIEHRSLTNYICGYNARFELDAHDRVFQFASFSFDVAGEEIYSTLVAGALLIVRSDRASLEPPELLAQLTDWGVTKMDLPTAYWHQFTTELVGRSMPPTLRLMITGGEAVRSEIVALWQEHWGDRPTLVNLYGPTETTMGVTSFQFPSGWRAERRVPIGVPFSNNQAYVLDHRGRPVPLGVAGELHIGGAQVARGYLNRPELSAEKFIPDPFGANPQGRLYRTGDLARWLPCGNLEFLGRVDSQVKIRGFRIELGEIERRLAAHPQVREVALLAREDQPGDKRLVAYVVPQREAGSDYGSRGAERVSLWKATHEDFHRELASDERGGFAGWNSSYDGSQIPLVEMRAWRDATVARILELRPRRVLEIGTGTGVLLTEIAPHCEAYYATDFSPAVLAYLNETVLAHAEYSSRVHLRHLEATDNGNLPAGWFDVIILNSVVQYFPNVEYLNRVLEQVEELLAADGVVFVGDVRNLRLHRQFRIAIEISRCPVQVEATDILLRIEHSLLSESELLIDPDFFAAYVARRPKLTGFDLRIRSERPHNELSRHRYDVVLRTKARTGADLSGVPARVWPAGYGSLEQVRRFLANERPQSVRLCGAPNARLAVENQLMRGLLDGYSTAALKMLLEHGSTSAAIEPENLVLLGRELGYVVIVTWSSRGSDGALDVLFLDTSRGGVSDPIGTYSVEASTLRESRAYSNTPRSKSELGDLVRDLRNYLSAHLPEYMVPSAFVVLGALPLNDRAKIDYKALPPPRRDAADNAEPTTETEASLAGLVATVLGLERIRMEDNFFELGGHSLTATQLMSRVRSDFKVELTLRDVFAVPQLRGLAARIDALQASRTDVHIRVLSRGEPLPASFAQERLWFIDQLATQGTDQRSSVYLMADALLLEGELDQRCLVAALQTIVERHETLRTALIEIGGRVMQFVQPVPQMHLPLTDLDALSGQEQHDALELRIRTFSNTGFDLAAGYLFRAELVRLGEQRHVLLLLVHHIVSDGWSMSILIHELSVLYSAYTAGKSDPLPPLPIQYADYTAWQRTAAEADRLEQQLAYWRRQLADLPLLSLPADRARPAEESFAGGHLRAVLPAELTKKLRNLAQANGVTLFMALSAGFALLLGRQANQTDIVFGIPIANRTRRELEGVIGFFVNTVVLRVRLEESLRFVDLLRGVAQTCLQAFANQDLPFERLVSAINPARSLSRNPLFQVMFQLLTNPYDRAEMAGLRVTPIEDNGSTSQFDLALDVEETVGGLVAIFEYNTDLFDPGTIKQLAKRFELLLEGIVADPNARILQFPILDESERERVLVEFNGPSVTSPSRRCVHERFERHTEQFPDALAVVCDDDGLTYSELNARSNRLARHLMSLGVGPDKLVALLLQRGTNMVVSMLAVLKAGGAYVPIDWKSPAERIRYMLEDCRAPLVLTDEHCLASSPRWPGMIVCIDRDGAQWADQPGTNLERSIDANSLAYVIYTSGSTGLPKGVLIEHRSLSSYIDAFTERCRLTRDDRVFQFASFSFDVSAEELYSGLVVGARVILRSDRTPLEPREFLRKIEEWDVTKLDLPTAYWHQFTDELVQSSLTMPHGLRLLTIGGEAVSPDRVVSWQQQFGMYPALMNVYGPTEATIGATCFEFTAGFRVQDPVLIGRPFSGVRAYVLDSEGQPTPIGVPGELHLGGVQVARGYLNHPQLTAEKFVPDPFTAEPSSRLYRTGDLARWLDNGNLECLGRIDSQVKIRGFRIELGEIESRLAVHPLVREVAVVAREDEPGTKRLVAYVVPREGSVAGGDLGRLEEQVSLWKTLHDDSYTSLGADAEAAFAGWNSSYDGQPLPLAEMQRWREATVDRILALNPRRVVEIGVGTGLLLREIAPHCETYYGTDFSQKVIDYLEQGVLPAAPYASKVRLLRLDATDLGEMPLGSFDVVVINSVVQYFPSVDYLIEVLRQAERLLCPGGTIFVGDVRNLRLHRQFRTGVEVFRSPATIDPTQLRLRIDQSVLSEIELLLDPDFFEAYAAQSTRCTGVDIQVRRDECDNELSRYRYDVVLCVDRATGPSLRELHALPWGGAISNVAQLDRQLDEQRPAALRLTGLPNARLAREGATLRGIQRGDSIAQLRHALAHGDDLPVPALTEFYQIGQNRNYHVLITWAGDANDGALDVIYVNRTHVSVLDAVGTYRPSGVLRPLVAYANTPTSKGELGEFALTLRRYLAGHLPEYMVPSAIVVLGSLPLNDRGKVELRALPAPENNVLERSYAAPQSPTEHTLGVIFAKALGLDRVGRNDNFFELGGHSLLAAQVASSIRRDMRMAVPVRELFTASSIAVLAARIDDGGFAVNATTPEPAPYDPLLSIQQGVSDGAPVFCVPGAGATIAYFAPLASHLGPGVSVYGLQPKGLDGDSSPHSSVEEMARAYVSAIEAARVRAPIRLLGHSFGALVACEMASQMLVRGMVLDVLILIDPADVATSGREPRRSTEAEALAELADFIGEANGCSLGITESVVRTLGEAERIELFRARLIEVGLISTQTPLSAIRGMAEVFETSINAAYRPKVPLTHPVAILRAQEAEPDKMLRLWSEVALELSVVDSPGNHMSMLAEPHVRALARHIRRVWRIEQDPSQPVAEFTCRR